jgi:hypothetical protein
MHSAPTLARGYAVHSGRRPALEGSQGHGGRPRMRWRGVPRGPSGRTQRARYVLPAAPWAFLGPSGGRRRGRQDHGRPHHDARRHLAGPTTPARPRGLGARRCGHLSLGLPLRSWGHCSPRQPGHRLPLVALMPQWRQDHPNKRPPTRATAISKMGPATSCSAQPKAVP